jgi:hypothetical protein
MASELMAEVREVVLAIRQFPAKYWNKILSTNLLVRFNE